MPDNPEIKRVWGKSARYFRDVIQNLVPGYHINDYQPGCGKTYNLAKVISKTNRSIAFFTSNHDHIKDFKEDLSEFGISKKDIIHGKGFERSCKRYPKKYNKSEWTDDEKLVYKIHKGFDKKSSRFLCNNCKEKDDCSYHEYTHHSKKYRITLQPLEFLFTDYNNDKDVFVVDETINKKENLYWDFAPQKLNNYIDNTKNYELKNNVEYFKNFHKTILQNNSLIFTESPDLLFNFNDRTFNDKDSFLQEGKYITHPGKINLGNYHETHGDLLWMLIKKILEQIDKYTDVIIREIIENGDSVAINKLTECYIPLRRCRQVFDILLCKSSFLDSNKNVCFLMNEKLEQESFHNLHSSEIIKTKGDFEYGFTTEYYPYICNINTNKCIISKKGKKYENSEKPLETLPDTFFTIGRPYLYQLFNIAEDKPIIFLDASYNNKIFKKLHKSWLPYRRINKYIIEGKKRSTNHLINFDRIERTNVTNKNSILYIVDTRGNSNYPLLSLFEKNEDGSESATNTLRKIVASINKINIENTDKKVTSISHIKIEKILNPFLGKNNTFHYYGQRGKNIDSEILICIGTPYTKPVDTLYDYILTFNEIPKSIQPIRTNKKFDGYKDEEFNIFLKSRVYDELYQALHRNRPLLYNRNNYLFGKLPERIEKELNIKQVNLDEICNLTIYRTLVLLDKLKDKNGAIWWKFRHNISRWKIFNNSENRPEDFIYELQKSGLITVKIKGTKKNPFKIVNFTRKGWELYRKYVKIYDYPL